MIKFTTFGRGGGESAGKQNKSTKESSWNETESLSRCQYPMGSVEEYSFLIWKCTNFHVFPARRVEHDCTPAATERFHCGPCQITNQNTGFHQPLLPNRCACCSVWFPMKFCWPAGLKISGFESIDKAGNKTQNILISEILKKGVVSKHTNINLS